MLHYSGTLNESHFPWNVPWKTPWIRNTCEQVSFSLEASPEFSPDQQTSRVFRVLTSC